MKLMSLKKTPDSSLLLRGSPNVVPSWIVLLIQDKPVHEHDFM